MRKISYKYELLDVNNVHKKWLTGVISANVRIVYLTQIKTTAEINMKDDSEINYLTDRIKIYMCIDNAEYPIGIFLMSTPSRDITSNTITRNIKLYDLCQILVDDKLEQRLVLEKGTNVIAQVKRLLGTWRHTISDNDGVLACQKVYDMGESKLTVINDLLSCLNYNSLRCDVNGYYVTEAYVEPTAKEIDTYYTADENSIICSNMTDTLDLFDVPNVFVRYTNAIDNTPLSYTYVNDNEASMTSTVNRGRRIVSVESTDATDIMTLAAKTKRAVFDTISSYNKIEFSVQVNEKLLNRFMQKVALNIKDIQDNYIVTSCAFDCRAGATAELEARKVVLI